MDDNLGDPYESNGNKCTEWSNRAYEQGAKASLFENPSVISSPYGNYDLLEGKRFPGTTPRIVSFPQQVLEGADSVGDGVRDGLRSAGEFIGDGAEFLYDGLIGLVPDATSPLVRAVDPNDKIAPAGFGDANAVTAGELMEYRIRFENLPDATAQPQAGFQFTEWASGFGFSNLQQANQVLVVLDCYEIDAFFGAITQSGLSVRLSTFAPSGRVGSFSLRARGTVGLAEGASPPSVELNPPNLIKMNHGIYFPGDPDFLAVELVSFEAIHQGDGEQPLLVWQTAAEINSIGFHLFRGVVASESGLSIGSRITAELIPNVGDPTQGAEYQFLDPKVHSLGSGDRYYFLEETDLSGVTTIFGPARLTDPGRTTSVGVWELY